MATVFYGIAGEGEHATRACRVIEALRGAHQVVLYSSGQALSMLGPMYRDTEVDVRAISGLFWRYGKDGRTNYKKTVVFALPFLTTLPLSIRRLRADIQRDQPDFILSDFEPIVALAARAEGVPLASGFGWGDNRPTGNPAYPFSRPEALPNRGYFRQKVGWATTGIAPNNPGEIMG